MKKFLLSKFKSAFACLFIVSMLVSISGKGQNGYFGTYFIDTSTVGNSTYDYTSLNNSALNGSSSALCLVTAKLLTSNDVYNDFNFGVWYTGTNWAVYREDGVTAIPVGSNYNVVVPQFNGSPLIQNTTVSNTFDNWTEIDNPLSNGNPNALVFFTHNYSISDLLNNKAMGVFYDNSDAKWSIYNEDETNFQTDDNFNVFITDSGSNAFVQVATNSNIYGNYTIISNPLLDGNPNAVIIASHNWSANGNELYNNTTIGVWYDGTNWTVYNQDTSTMQTGMAFNILIANNATPVIGAYGSYFTDTADSLNSYSSLSYFSHDSLNNNANGLCLVTPILVDPHDVYNNFNIGVYYTGTNWSVYNENVDSIPYRSSYNVLIPTLSSSAYVHESAVSTITDNWTDLDNPVSNNNPNALVFFNHNYSGGSGQYNNHAMGVWYDAGNSKWAIYNEDETNFQSNDGFNVLAVNPSSDAFVFRTDSSNITGSNYALISNSHLDGNPNAVIIISHNYSANGDDSYFNHPFGVWYSTFDNKWTIFAQDYFDIPAGIDFNVLIVNDITTGVNEVSSPNFEFKVFPNPATDRITINFNAEANSSVKVSLRNSIGQLVRSVYEGRTGSGNQNLTCDISNLSTGIYFAEIILNETVSVRKIIVMK